MKTIKTIILLFIVSFTFNVGYAQEFGDNACENYAILIKSAENNFKSLPEITDGGWIESENGRYITKYDFKIIGIDGFLMIEPGNKQIYVINKIENYKANIKEKMNAHLSLLEKCLNVKSTNVIVNGVNRIRFVVKNTEKKYTVTFDIMFGDAQETILTYILKTEI